MLPYQIINDALRADDDIMRETGGRIYPVCIEVPPMDQDKTPLPYIVIMKNGFSNQPGDKDREWEDDEETTMTSVLVSAKNPKSLDSLVTCIRKAVAGYIGQMDYGERPALLRVSSEGSAWDWTRPCYHETINYQCLINTEDNAE